MNEIPLNQFAPFPKMPRLNREVVITEKIDGSNAQVIVIHRDDPCWQAEPYMACQDVVSMSGDFVLLAASRTRLIRPKNPGEKGDPDNYGFAAWVRANADELVKLGPGRHFGEWFGSGINRNYGLDHKRFALFNTARWLPIPSEAQTVEEWGKEIVRPGVRCFDENLTLVDGPACCHVVPLIWRGEFSPFDPIALVEMLRSHGSFAVPGFMRPEGIVIFHTASQRCYKVTLENDSQPKSVVVGIA